MFKMGMYTKLVKNIRSTPFYAFGIMPNDNFHMTDIANHIKKFKNRSELELELNKLANYIYNGKRTIFFHEFREFPYIIHENNNSSDMSGSAKNYTNSDIYLIKFIKKCLTYQSGKYSFFDVDFIIENTKKIEFYECPINNMPIDEILK
ncbi:hypothetical protein HYI18_12860 [Clostridium botulinum]|uniref:Uncharacterized protein n=1 Tax=Clostridium sporogenes TaxID=1509 RepID=A0A1L3NLQ8_CLOSG|nr:MULTISPECIES: hypothetical protein [Clostridium]APH17050.1 hypothetical protein NPD5_3924 [Clostridium sporogenes]MBD5639465.1 hypothetical protein [Clostridium botulinum]MDI6918990.1 hypothetical protein [Clostridium botulinum]WMU99792.1 hypothetical protein QA656_19355 [Clostridium botulinum]